MIERVMNWFSYSESALLANAVSSLILLAVVLLLRFLLVQAVKHQERLAVASRRRWLVSIRNVMFFLLLTGLVFIWANEVRTFAVSIVAIAAAVVLATKELFMCLSGAFLRAAANAYSVGDWIELGGMRGLVVDYNLFATTILETGPGKGYHQNSGRAVVIPNSLLLTTPLITETFTGDYAVHAIAIPLSVEDDWQKAERLLLEIATAECAPFLDDARRHMEMLQKKYWLATPSVEPRVSIEIQDPKRISLLLRIPIPVRQKGPIEQAILRRFLAEFYQAEARPQQENPKEWSSPGFRAL
jgi:small-conductance mechanosensitive channel